MDPDTNFCPVEIKGPKLTFRMFLTAFMALSMVVLSLLSTPSVQSSAASAWPMFHGNAQHTGLSIFPGPTVPFLRWKFQTGGPVYSPPAVGRGRIYVGSYDGNLYALNLQGVLLWKFQTPSPIITTPAIGSDGTIYLASHIRCIEPPCYGVLYAINPGGRMIWNLTILALQGPALSSPTIGPDGTIYTSQLGFRTYAVNPDGTVKWQLTTNGEVFDSPAVAPDGTLYVGVDDPDTSESCDQCLLALNSDGTVRWSAIPKRAGFSWPAIGSDGTVYINGYAINPDGTVKWQNPGTFGSPSIGPDGAIYGAREDIVNSINPDGVLRWQFPIERPSGSGNPCCFYGIVGLSSMAIGSNGILYFGVGVEGFCSCAPVPSGYGNASLYAVAPNGTLAWKFVIHPTVTCATFDCPLVLLSDPAIGSDGTIYIGSGDGNLYAIG